MPKKLTPKSQAKKKKPIPVIPIFNYFFNSNKSIMQTNIQYNYYFI